MNVVNITKARQNFYKLIEQVNESSEPVTIVNSKGKNAILISEDDWNSLQETNYINSIPGLADSILEGEKEPLSECTKYVKGEEW